MVLYADDTAIFFPHKDARVIEYTLQEELSIAQHWLNYNKLTLNVKKTKCMLLGTKHNLANSSLCIYSNNTALDCVSSFKYLGVTIDQSLTWSAHIDHTCGKIAQRLGILRRIRKYLTRDTAILLYNAIVLPLFDYADLVWTTCKKNDLCRLARLQKRGARIILEVGRRDFSSAHLFNILGWLPLTNRHDLHTVTMVYKSLHNRTPTYITDLFINVDQVHQHNTRQSNKLFIVGGRTSHKLNSFKHRGSTLWNSLPETIRIAPSPASFTRRCHKFMRETASST